MPRSDLEVLDGSGAVSLGRPALPLPPREPVVLAAAEATSAHLDPRHREPRDGGVGRPARLHLRALPGTVRDRARAFRVLPAGRCRGWPNRHARQSRLSHLRGDGGDEGQGARGRPPLRLAHGPHLAGARRVVRAGRHALAGGHAVRAARAAPVALVDELRGAAGRPVHRGRHARRGDRPIRPRAARARRRPPAPGGPGIAHGPRDHDALDRPDGNEGDPGRGATLAAVAALGFEEFLQQGAALGAEHTAPRRDAMVRTAVIEQPMPRLDGAGLRIQRAVDDARETGLDDGPTAHRARLERRVERGAREPVVAGLPGGLAQGENLGVSGGVAEGDRRVVRLPDDHVVEDDQGAHGDLAAREADTRLGERRPHECFSVQLLRAQGLSTTVVWSTTTVGPASRVRERRSSSSRTSAVVDSSAPRRLPSDAFAIMTTAIRAITAIPAPTMIRTSCGSIASARAGRTTTAVSTTSSTMHTNRLKVTRASLVESGA